MSESKKDITVSTDDVKTDTSMFEETVKWEELLLARQDAVNVLMQQQQLIVELTKLKEKEINENDEVFAMVDGLLKSLNDIGKDINEISVMHASVTTEQNGVTICKEFKTGDIAGDDELVYIDVASKYIAISEKISQVVGIVYVDILTKLNVDSEGVAGIADIQAEGVAEVAAVQDELDKTLKG